MFSLACFVISWPALLFVLGIFLAFVSLIVGGIAWIFSWTLGVPSWKVLCAEAVGLSLMALVFGLPGSDGDSGFFFSLSGSGACLFLLAVNWVFRRFRRPAESDTTPKPYSFYLNEDSSASPIQEAR